MSTPDASSPEAERFLDGALPRYGFAVRFGSGPEDVPGAALRDAPALDGEELLAIATAAR